MELVYFLQVLPETNLLLVIDEMLQLLRREIPYGVPIMFDELHERVANPEEYGLDEN